MTVSDPGAGQQQGREELELEAHELRPGDVILAVEDDAYDGKPRMTVDRPAAVAVHARHPSGLSPFPSPTPPAREGCECSASDLHDRGCTPPARDSGRDEAREAVARWLYDMYGELPVRAIDPWLRDADRLLALPELDKLLRRPA